MSLAESLQRLAEQTELLHRRAAASADAAQAGGLDSIGLRDFETDTRSRLLEIHRILQHLPAV